VTCRDATLRHGTALEPSITGGCTMGSVTAARVAAPTLLDVIPSFRQAGEGRRRAMPCRTTYLGAFAPGFGGVDHIPRSSIGPGLSRLLSVRWESWISASASSTGCACPRTFHASTSPSRALLSCARTNTSWWSSPRWKASRHGRPTAHRRVARTLDQGHAPHRRARAPRCRGGSTTSQGSA